MFRWLFGHIEHLVDSLITKRLILFHDALVKRKQIPQMPIMNITTED